jgi:PAS domain S-box-containing protein
MSADVDDFFEALAEHSHDAVIYVDASGIVQFWNAGAETILGFRRDEAVGRPVDIIIPERLRERHWDGFRRVIRAALRSGSTLPPGWVVTQAMRKDGVVVPLDITILLVRHASRRVRGVVALMCSRRTEYKQAD